MNSNLKFVDYNYDCSCKNLPLNISINRRMKSARFNRNNSYSYKSHIQKKFDEISNYQDNNIFNLNQNNTNKYRLENLEERISSLEKMLHYLDEFIHLKEQIKKDNINNLIAQPLIVKLKSLEKKIQKLQKEKEENKKKISELNGKIANIEKKLDNYSKNFNEMKDKVYSLKNKEKKLNLLLNDFSDITKENNTIINNQINEKINKFNYLNENRINELLALFQDINKIIEQNENKVNKLNENVEKVQSDNLNIIKHISIQEQKFKTFDLIMKEFNNLKEKFYLIMNNNILGDNLKINLIE